MLMIICALPVMFLTVILVVYVAALVQRFFDPLLEFSIETLLSDSTRMLIAVVSTILSIFPIKFAVKKIYQIYKNSKKKLIHNKKLFFMYLYSIYYFGKSENLYIEMVMKIIDNGMLVKAIKEKNFFQIRLAACQLAISRLEKEEKSIFKAKLLQKEKIEADTVYKDLRIIQARMEGKEQAWEGIRIVRERKE